MEEYKQYINGDADEDERRAAEQVMEGLAELRLEAKVREVAAQRQALRRRGFWQRIFVSMVALALVGGAAYLILGQKQTPAPPPTQQPKQQQQPIPPSAGDPDIPFIKPQDKKENAPIAQVSPGERLPNPSHLAPEITMMRGDEQVNKALKALLDQIWYTDYPLKGLKVSGSFKQADESLKKRDFIAAYLELEQLEGQMAGNDTLRYLKGYCLLEMAEGNEALTYFDPLQGRHAAWEPQLQWYRGLAMLLADKRPEALAQFKRVAAKPGHLYRRQAEKALKLLQ